MAQLKKITQTLSFRSIVIAILTVVMFVPLLMVNNMVNERGHRYQSVLNEIASSWGQPQTIIGPILAIPYVEHLVTVDTVTDSKGNTETISKDVFNDYTMILLPQELILQGDMKEAYRQRGIYKSLVYSVELTISGQYNIKPLFDSCTNNCSIKWDKAWISLGLSDTKAINETSRMNWGGASTGIHPGTLLPELIPSGFHASLKGLEPETATPNFRLRLSLNGSEGIRFAPLGEVTQATIKSAWAHPSYQGSILPKKEKHGAEGFLAQWQITNLTRNYPQYWLSDKKYDLHAFTAGVDLFEPVTHYSKVSRAIKYGILFIILTFITFLIFELTIQARPHFLQYTLIGFAISLFYLLLVSLAEHVKFLHAYIAATGITVFMITLYAAAMLKKFSRALLIFFLLSGLYAVLYTIMHLEDYALLAGAALLLVVMGVLMLVTRNIQTQ